jgi:hypothetical protein
MMILSDRIIERTVPRPINPRQTRGISASTMAMPYPSTARIT